MSWWSGEYVLCSVHFCALGIRTKSNSQQNKHVCLKPMHAKCLEHSGVFDFESTGGVHVHKLFVLSRCLYCEEPHPLSLPKTPGYVVRFTIKTPVLCHQYKMFRLQMWKMTSMERCKNTGYKWQLMLFELFSGEIHWYAEVLCEQIEWKKYFLFYKCHVTLLISFYFVLFLSDTVLFYFILQTKAMKTKNWHRMNLQLI